jgi:hypothetical protein
MFKGTSQKEDASGHAMFKTCADLSATRILQPKSSVRLADLLAAGGRAKNEVRG